jgi:NTE family protein
MELGWKPNIITGTSVGCLNGALFVMDRYEAARDMWLSLRSRDVMTLPEGTSLSEWQSFLRDVVEAGGLDVTPLESVIDRMLDEDVMRAASIRYGLVTVELDQLRTCELTLEQIPQGMLKDYMLASAACFPAMRPRTINGKRYLDGGYSDNMPQGLAKDMGATELLCVDVDGVGVTRPNVTGLPTTTIRSHWDLGSLLVFSPTTARRNMELGYYDALRTFGHIRGSNYAVAAKQPERAVRLRVRFDLQLAALRAAWPAVAVAIDLALSNSKMEDGTLAPLEIAAEQAGVDPTYLYTAEGLAAAFAEAYDGEQTQAFLPLLDGAGTRNLAARAALSPKTMIQLLMYRAVTEST